MEDSAANPNLPASAGREPDYRIGILLRRAGCEDPLETFSSVTYLGRHRTQISKPPDCLQTPADACQERAGDPQVPVPAPRYLPRWITVGLGEQNYSGH